MPYPTIFQPGGGKEISDICLKTVCGQDAVSCQISLAGHQLAQTLPLDFVVHSIQPADWILLKDWKVEWTFSGVTHCRDKSENSGNRWNHHNHAEPTQASENWTSGLKEDRIADNLLTEPTN